MGERWFFNLAGDTDFVILKTNGDDLIKYFVSRLIVRLLTPINGRNNTRDRYK